MRVDRAGLPFVAAATVPALLLAAVDRLAWATPFALLAMLFVFFFRDPERQPPTEPGLVLAPADGRVIVAGPAEPTVAPPGRWLQVSIFLSPCDVHVNRVPVTGRVTRITTQRGSTQPAYRREAAHSNTRTELWFDADGHPVVCRQVVGVLARRAVCRLQPGAEVRAGDRLGIMKFGSRMDVFVPPTAVLQVRAGDRVRAAETVIAVLPPSMPRTLRAGAASAPVTT